MTPHDIEKLEEAKLKAKYPTTNTGRPIAGHSAFLQKRLAKGVSYHNIVTVVYLLVLFA